MPGTSTADAIAQIKAEIIWERDHLWNLTNPSRTDYYFDFYDSFPEVPWVLMAHLVSRNAGWQMSDFARYAGLEWIPPWLPDTILNTVNSNTSPGILAPASVLWGILEVMKCCFAYLERGNFLIFRDVFPALEAYKAARNDASLAPGVFEMLKDPEINADPFAVSAWEMFFGTVCQQADINAFAAQTQPGSPIELHSFSLVCNEQNQIEDRLVNDPTSGLLQHFTSNVAGAATWISEFLQDAFLCLPAKPVAGGDAQDLYVYPVAGFANLSHRIQIGRDLYTGLFGAPTASLGDILSWVNSHDVSYGTRAEYNAANYTPQRFTGKKYSPPLRTYLGTPPTLWYQNNPGATPILSSLHAPPAPLATSVANRTFPPLSGSPVTLDDLLYLQTAMLTPFTTPAPSELAEITEQLTPYLDPNFIVNSI